MKKKGKKPIIKSRVIVEGTTDNTFVQNKLPTIIQDLERLTNRELRVVLSPALNVSTTNIFKNVEPLPKETPRKDLKNIVSSTPYCGRYVDTQFTSDSSLPSPIHLGNFKTTRYKNDKKRDVSSSSDSSSVVFIGSEVNNSFEICKNAMEELRPEELKNCKLLETNSFVEADGREQFKRNETHVQSKSSNKKQKMSAEASVIDHKSQNQEKKGESISESTKISNRDANFSNSSNKKKAEVSLKTTISMTKNKKLLQHHNAQSSSKDDKRRKLQLDASHQHSLDIVEISGSQRSQPKTVKRNVSTVNASDIHVTDSLYNSTKRMTRGSTKRQACSEESGIVPLKINKSRSRLHRLGRLTGSLRAVEEPKDLGSSGKINPESKQMVDKPIDVQCRPVQVNTETSSPMNQYTNDGSITRSLRLIARNAKKQSDKEEKSIVSLENPENRSRYVNSRCKKPDGTSRATEELNDFGTSREINISSKQIKERIDVQHRTVQANTQTSPPSKHYMSAEKSRRQYSLKGSFKDVLIEMERQARLKLATSVPAWTQTSGLTFGNNENLSNSVEGLGADIIQEIAAKKSQRMCNDPWINTMERNPTMSESVKVRSSAATQSKVEKSKVAANVCKTPLLNGARQLNKENNVDFSFIQSLKTKRTDFNQQRLNSFENLITKLEAHARAAQENGENSDSAISFNSNMSSNRRFKLPQKSSNADENFRFLHCNSKDNKLRKSRKTLDSVIEKLTIKGAAGQNVLKKSTKNGGFGVKSPQVSSTNQKSKGMLPLFRRSSIKQSYRRLEYHRRKKKMASSVSSYESSTDQSVPSNPNQIPNIYDSIAEGNVADCLNFSALSDACFIEYTHKPWRCSVFNSHIDTSPRLSSIQSEATIVADAPHEFDDDSDDESSDFDVNRTLTNNNVSLVSYNVSASKGKPHYRRYSKCKARNTQNRKSLSYHKAPLSLLEAPNNLDDGLETEIEVVKNVTDEVRRSNRKCSLRRTQNVSEIRQDEVASQILSSSSRNLVTNFETTKSRISNRILDRTKNAVNTTPTPTSPTPTSPTPTSTTPTSTTLTSPALAQVSFAPSIIKSSNRRDSKHKANKGSSPVILQQTLQKTNEENVNSSDFSFDFSKNKAKTQTLSQSNTSRLQSTSVAAGNENLQPATSKKEKRKGNWDAKSSTVESFFSKKKAYSTDYPLADVSEINIIPSSGIGRSMRNRKTKTFEMPRELQKDGFVFSHEKKRGRVKLSTQKTKKRGSKKFSVHENQKKNSFQDINAKRALPPIKENDVNENVDSGSIEMNENRFNEMPPPRTVPVKKKIPAVINGEVSTDSGFETSNTGRKTGKTSRGHIKRNVVRSDVAGSSASERDFGASEQESNALLRISSPIHNTSNIPESDGNSLRTDELSTKRRSLRTRNKDKRSLDLSLNKYAKVGDAYIYKLYNTPDKQCEVGYLRLEGGGEIGCLVFSDYSSVALSVKLGSSFVNIEDKSFFAKIDDWFHVLRGQKYTIRNTSHDQYLKLIYMKLR